MKLLLCPFCGKEAKLSKSHQWRSVKGTSHKSLIVVWKVFCKYCFGQTTYCRSEEQPIKRWNKRQKNDHRFGYLQRKAIKEKTNANSSE